MAMKTLIGFCALILMSSCVEPLKLTGRACGCATGYICCETTGICITPSEMCPPRAPDAEAPDRPQDSRPPQPPIDPMPGPGDAGADTPEAGTDTQSPPADTGTDTGADAPAEAPPAGPWTPIAADPLIPGRSGHTALWTGEEMIVWGGHNNLRVFHGGARFNPKTGVWTAMSELSVSGRSGHTAVWTGTEMIVWGGTVDPQGTAYSPGGASYDPKNDRWTPLPTEDAVAPRIGHSAIWTGEEMLLWGGQKDSKPLTDVPTAWVGARYHPTRGWSQMSFVDGPPNTYSHSAVWADDRMIVWGGNSPERHRSVISGGMYDPVRDAWIATSFDGNPGPRLWHTAVWTGTWMIVWGGYNNNPPQPPTPWTLGGRFDPKTNSWSPMAVTDAGGTRLHHAAVWAPAPVGKMLIWGGVDQPTELASATLATGAAYDVAGNQWAPLSMVGGPGPRHRHTALWTGAEMILWGGLDLNQADVFVRADGARYKP